MFVFFFNSKRVPEGEERCRKKAQSSEAPGPELRREQVSIWGAVTACGCGLFLFFYLLYRERERQVNVCDHLVADKNNLDLWKDCLWNMMWDWLLTVSCVYVSGFLDDRGNSQWVTLLCWQAGGVMEILENSLGVLGSELGWKVPEWKHLTKSCDSVMLSNHCGTVKTSQVFFCFFSKVTPPRHPTRSLWSNQHHHHLLCLSLYSMHWTSRQIGYNEIMTVFMDHTKKAYSLKVG